MTQVQEGLRPHRPTWLSVNRVVVLVASAAVAAVTALLWLAPQASPPLPLVDPTPTWLLVLFVVLAALSDIVYVPVRHADAWEELTFVEVALVCGIILLPPALALLTALAGFTLAEVLARRQWIKTVFNVSSFAVGAAVMIAVYLLVVGQASPFSWRSMLALIAATLAYTAMNLIALSLVLLAADDVPPREFIAEQWVLSLGMAVGSVGIATVALAILDNTPVLLPFAALPAAAMWYAYRASASHAESRERSRWLVAFGQAVSSPAPAEELLPPAADALRRAYGADAYAIVRGDGSSFGADWAPVHVQDREAITLDAGQLPTDWGSGVAVRFDDESGSGCLAIGVLQENFVTSPLPWARSWSVSETDLPGLVALTSAMSSALRAGQTLSALTAETAKLQAVVDHATDGICVVDGRGRVLLWSPAAEAITGTSALDPLPQIVRDITAVPADGRGHSLEFVRADGQDVSLQVTRVEVWGSLATSVLTIRDMTRERRAERLKSDFIATISHELRTPITPIRGYADLLRRRWDRMSEEKRASVLDTIEERAEHLARLVDDLLIAARADSETSLRVESAPMELVSAVVDAATAFPEVDGRLHIDPSPPRWVTADRTRVMQIVGNLVGNAVKYTPQDAPIRVQFSAADGAVDVSVVDAGPGIAADEQERVFERFYRIEDPLTMRTGGSGLGLHISRQLARAMGGDVTLRSSPGDGSTFVLRLREAEAEG
ncbi:MAG: ATP-binding protein [Candidatus Nanopelagicales bacterium]